MSRDPGDEAISELGHLFDQAAAAPPPAPPPEPPPRETPPPPDAESMVAEGVALAMAEVADRLDAIERDVARRLGAVDRALGERLAGMEGMAERVEALEAQVDRLRTALRALGKYVKRQAEARGKAEQVWREPSPE